MSSALQKSAVALVVLALFAADCARGAPAPAATEFARIADGSDGQPRSLQLAVVTYAPPRGGSDVSIDLISAIHVGDKAYYDALNDRFRDYDALLYEMILPEDPVASDRANETDDAGAAREADSTAPALSFISNTQIGMKNALGLTFQLDEIDYSPANFVHADLTTPALAQQMAERKESLYVYFWRLFFASMDEYARDPLGLKDIRLISSLIAGKDDALKVAIAQEMVNAAHRPDILGGEEGSAVIAARNEHAVEILKQRLARGDRRIGIFYGVGHMTDLEQRLQDELGLRILATTWIDAWDLTPAETTAAQ